MGAIPPTDPAEPAFDCRAARCDARLADATRSSGAGGAGVVHFRFLRRARDRLDDIDEALLVVRAERDEDRRAAEAAMQRRVEARPASAAPQLRDDPGRARRPALPHGEACG